MQTAVIDMKPRRTRGLMVTVDEVVASRHFLPKTKRPQAVAAASAVTAVSSAAAPQALSAEEQERRVLERVLEASERAMGVLAGGKVQPIGTNECRDVARCAMVLNRLHKETGEDLFRNAAVAMGFALTPNWTADAASVAGHLCTLRAAQGELRGMLTLFS